MQSKLSNTAHQEVKKSLFKRILTEKCPSCGLGQVFEKKKSPFQLPVMYARCTKCDYLFDREPGYFLGAMYISYGLAVLEGILTFLICYFFFPDLPTIAVCFILVGIFLFFSMRNYRLSRVIYMYIFPD
jgi:uncharacterized protein (DUF983 family)